MQQTIEKDLEVLENLDTRLYPVLCSNADVLTDLRCILEMMHVHTRPFDDKYYQLAVNFVRDCAKEHGISRSLNVWQSRLIYLQDTGLLTKLRDINELSGRVRAKYFETTNCRGTKSHGVGFYTVSEYTPELLSAAEATAKSYKDKGINLTKITKADVIRVSGQDRADELYSDERKIPAPESRTEKYALEALKTLVSSNGYATKDQISEAIDAIFEERMNFVPYEEIPHTPEGVAKLEQEMTYWKARDKIIERISYIANEADCVYRRIRKGDRDKFSFDSKDNRCIIVSAEYDAQLKLDEAKPKKRGAPVRTVKTPVAKKKAGRPRKDEQHEEEGG